MADNADDKDKSQNVPEENDSDETDDESESNDESGSDTNEDDGSESDQDEDTDNPTELKKLNESLKEKNRKLFERTKKAEGFVKDKDGNWVKKIVTQKPKAEPSNTKKEEGGLTPMDAILLSKADVTDAEDIEEIVRYSNYQRLTNPKFGIKDALKDKTMQAILKDRAEERATANATNTDPKRRGSTKPSAEKVLEEADQGKMPESPEDLAEAHWQQVKAKSKK